MLKKNNTKNIVQATKALNKTANINAKALKFMACYAAT